MEQSIAHTPAQAGDIITYPWLFTLLPLKAADQHGQVCLNSLACHDHQAPGPLAAARAGRSSNSSAAVQNCRHRSAPTRVDHPTVTSWLQQVSETRSKIIFTMSNVESSTEEAAAAVNRHLQQLMALANPATAPDPSISQQNTAPTPQQQQQQEGCQQQDVEDQYSVQLDRQQQQEQMQQQQHSSSTAQLTSQSQSYLLRRSLVFQWVDTLLPNSASNTHSSSRTWHASTANSTKSNFSSGSGSSNVTVTDALHEAANVLLAAATWHMVKAAKLVNPDHQGHSAAAGAGTSSSTAMQAYKHYRTAAGLFDCIQQQLLPQLLGWLGHDLDPLLLAALQDLALAEAQSLTLQRAMVKSHQPSLIAGIATDTAVLYASAYKKVTSLASGQQPQQQQQQISTSLTTAMPTAAVLETIIMTKVASNRFTSPARYLPKLTCYLQYQICYCYTVTAVHQAESELSEDHGGVAVAWAQEAIRLVKHCNKLGIDFDRMDPPTSRGCRQQLEQTLDNKTQSTLTKCVKDNHSIYFHPVPKVLPPLPTPKRAADPLPFTLPAAAALDPLTIAAITAAISGGKVPPDTAAAATAAGDVVDGVSSETWAVPSSIKESTKVAAATVQSSVNGHQQQDMKGSHNAAAAAAVDSGDSATAQNSSCSCWRVCVLIVCYPLLLVVSVVGILVWLLLLPFKLCCCCLPCACAVQAMWNVLEYLIKAPLKGFIWAAGSTDSNSSSRSADKQKKSDLDIEAQ